MMDIMQRLKCGSKKADRNIFGIPRGVIAAYTRGACTTKKKEKKE